MKGLNLKRVLQKLSAVSLLLSVIVLAKVDTLYYTGLESVPINWVFNGEWETGNPGSSSYGPAEAFQGN